MTMTMTMTGSDRTCTCTLLNYGWVSSILFSCLPCWFWPDLQIIVYFGIIPKNAGSVIMKFLKLKNILKSVGVCRGRGGA